MIATSVAGPARGMPWIRGGTGDLTGAGHHRRLAMAARSARKPM
ncbi:hypothetical protein [Candidatus Aalborgicola defluviihabitans]